MTSEREFIPVNIAILTVSDTRTESTDGAGDLLARLITETGHNIAARAIVRDEQTDITARLTEWCATPDIDVIISTGGTGLTARDVTVEAHRAVYDKEIDAFGAMFAMVSMDKIGTSAVQSRACGGVAQGTYLFALPGSPSACRDGWESLLKPQLDYRHKPCNFVEIIQRLTMNCER